MFMGYRRMFLVAGALSIVTSIVYYRDGWRLAVARGLCGASCVLFVAPAAIRQLSRFVVMDDDLSNLVAWTAGMFGIAIVAFLAKAARNPLAAVQEWLRIKQGGGPAP